ncbi:MAG: hypothetical protein IM585_08885 [Pseudanabaena sp. M135S2SP2A07QC]|nr:hypothetical protein [Pseudanabaena sp. M176S2SP2A07QC]MCA6541549.1 hypothetical protein [Pseudanabaena sp. M037S2SP2A07QC]MCA6543661.1 hypothetical protein [Pseudanabaena sp. M074S1SP2A07QC]MCA6550359.1 hypothetical protein [Pseudanabaena sp. M152S2SP2A07QC]MCA6552109.1 hypothetical protein [Pseudanabaena sp. M135S2SP2A07QC]MCA6557287.1 hypothetical protein [Pseudanabaena sp. M114S2SP2A07QC]MCA6565567.1 hypothetical protein [Pseudanabaena sp. M151S2SP2A07QC]MCA6571213.1 hypothetical prot
MIQIPPDFKEFLRLLNFHQVEYLLIGGYAVGYYGFVRATGDMDVWVKINPDNAIKVVSALKEFGFAVPELSPELFLKEDQIVRMGVPPLRLEILTTISGVEFTACFKNRLIAQIDDLDVNLINLEDLKLNKRASRRLKDLLDLENLP